MLGFRIKDEKIKTAAKKKLKEGVKDSRGIEKNLK